MSKPRVSIQVVVFNGERYLRHCLEAIAKQTFNHSQLELVIFDNASIDKTVDISRSILNRFSSFHSARIIENDRNIGMWPAHEHLLAETAGEFILPVSVDVILHPEFIDRALKVIEPDSNIGAVQAKIFQYNHSDLQSNNYQKSFIIDTCGFALTRERKVVNIGHGRIDGDRYSYPRDIFGVEGAVPFFRRSALEYCRMDDWIWDPDYFWYGDDLDLAWRMTLFGYRQVFAPNVIAWHDRSTTKGSTNTGLLTDYVKRRLVRQKIPLFKRRLDWSNTRFTIIKNDYFRNIVYDIWPIVIREFNVQGYAWLFEQGILLEWGRFLKLLPRMILRRRAVMSKAVLSLSELRELMISDVREAGIRTISELWWKALQIVVPIVLLALIFFLLILFRS